MIRLHCNNCGAHLKVHEDRIGQTLSCPKCRTKIQIPPATRPELPPPPTPPVREAAQPNPDPPAIPEHLRPKSKKPVGKSPASPVVPSDQEAIIHRVIDSLIRAFCAGKLAFFGLGTIASLLLTIGLSVIVSLVSKLDTPSMIVLFVMSALVSTGLAGVVAGGVAFMFCQERKGRPNGIAVGIQFCVRRFGVLFVDTGAAVLVVLLLYVGLNLTIAKLNTIQQIGSLIGGALFLPQIICNVLLLLGLLTCVLVPCIVALTDVGLFGALKRFFQYLGRHGRALMIHFAASLYFGIQIFLVILPLMLFAFATTLSTNGPDLASPGSRFSWEADGMFGGTSDGFGDLPDSPFGDASFLSGQFSGRSSPEDPSGEETGAPWGGGLRWIGIAIAVLVPFCYFCVFWIGSFTRFSEDLENPPNPARDIKISVSVDQGQGAQSQEVTA